MEKEEIFSHLIQELSHMLSTIFAYGYYMGPLDEETRKDMVDDNQYHFFVFTIDLIRYLENINYRKGMSEAEINKYLIATYWALRASRNILSSLFSLSTQFRSSYSVLVIEEKAEGKTAAVSKGAYLSRVLEIIRYASRVIKRITDDYIAFSEDKIREILDEIYNVIENSPKEETLYNINKLLTRTLVNTLKREGLDIDNPDPNSDFYRKFNAALERIASIRR